MAYNDTPLPTETPSQSQPLMRQNFQQIGTSYNTDHIPLSSGSNVGYSNKLTLVSQGSDPGAVVGSGIIYTKTIAGQIQAFFENPSTIAQLTGFSVVSLGIAGGNTVYGITTPWGVIMNWGLVSFTTSIGPFNYAVPFSSVQSIVVGSNNTNPTKNSSFNNTSPTQLQLFNSGNYAVGFFAIGN